MSKQVDFNDWLQGRHSKWATPQTVIDSYVAKASGSKTLSCNRLVIGQENEVYDVVTADNQKLIVRISHMEDPRFEAERWALDAARQAGVPTPQVLLVEQVDYEKGSITFCIEEKLPGEPLEVAIKGGITEELDSAIEKIGDVLSKLHSVKVDGFGYLQSDGKGWPIAFSEIMLDLNEKQSELGSAAKEWGLLPQKVTHGLALLNDNQHLYGFDTPSLTHGDFGLPHILVEGDQITGIIDMQECSGNHPVFDFVHWDAYWREVVPTSKIMASYGNSDLFKGDYEALFHLALLRRSLWMLMVHVEHKNPHGIEGFKDGIDRALRHFNYAD